jgi:hypothetical protein
MSLRSPFITRLWIAVPLLALGFLVWSHASRVQRVKYVTSVVSGDAVVSRASPTGYAGGIRNLFVPQQNADSFYWIAQTQQMLATKEWRIRRVEYEDAPYGRETYAPSPYRWWLGLVAGVDQDISGRPAGISVERAAVIGDPLLQMLLLVAAVALTAWQFGAWPAALLSVGLVAIFPFGAGFFPGAPDDKTLSRASSLLSLLTLWVGIKRGSAAVSTTNAAITRSGIWFVVSGVLGAMGLWVSVADQIPIILGIVVGGLLAAWSARRGIRQATILPRDWLVWALAGSGSGLVFYLIEYFPAYLGSWRLHVIHPVYSAAWLGLGIALAGASEWGRGEWKGWSVRALAAAAFALLALACVPVLMWRLKDAGFLETELWSLRLSRIPGTAEAANLWMWLRHDGFSPALIAALLPSIIILPAIWIVLRTATNDSFRASVAVALGPVLVTAGFAAWQIGRTSSFDTAWLALLVPLTAALCTPATHRFSRWIWAACLGAMLVPGARLLWPSTGAPESVPLNESELGGLISRDLAHWLAKSTAADQAVILAPPDETMALSYYGGLRGIAALGWESRTDIGAAVRIFSASTPQEALARVQRREITHIVVPSWNRYLDEYFRAGGVNVETTFLLGLRNWTPIPWLKPLPYQLPAVAGYEGQLVGVFEVVEEQNEQTILSWQAEYFAEMGQLDYAGALSRSLQRFPADLGAWLARAEVATARQDSVELAEAVRFLTAKLKSGAERSLPWDRRVALAVVLAQAKQTDLAREQVERCFADVNERRLRRTSTSTLYRLLVLAKAFGLEIKDARLRSLALDLLPTDWRSRL